MLAATARQHAHACADDAGAAPLEIDAGEDIPAVTQTARDDLLAIRIWIGLSSSPRHAERRVGGRNRIDFERAMSCGGRASCQPASWQRTVAASHDQRGRQYWIDDGGPALTSIDEGTLRVPRVCAGGAAAHLKRAARRFSAIFGYMPPSAVNDPPGDVERCAS